MRFIPDQGHPKGRGNLATCGICGADRWADDLVEKQLQVRGGGTARLYVCKEQGRCNDPYHPQNDYGSKNEPERPPLVRQRL